MNRLKFPAVMLGKLLLKLMEQVIVRGVSYLPVVLGEFCPLTSRRLRPQRHKRRPIYFSGTSCARNETFKLG